MGILAIKWDLHSIFTLLQTGIWNKQFSSDTLSAYKVDKKQRQLFSLTSIVHLIFCVTALDSKMAL